MKNVKKAISLLLSLMLVLGAVAVGGMTASADDDGIVWNAAENRYEISNYAGLKAFADIVNGISTMFETNPSACAVLTADIVCKNNPADTGYATDWTPIGKDSGHKYTGTFDGDGHKITGLAFNDSSAVIAGFFGDVEGVKDGDETVGGIVKNVGLEDGKITGNRIVGGVVGFNVAGLITGCYFKGAVSGDTQIGGITGYNDSGTVENCYNTGEVSGSNRHIGGVVGYNNKATVRNCFNTGKISGSSFVGGVVGRVSTDSSSTNISVTNCYNTGEVSGSDSCGGIIGCNHNSIVSNCYTTGNINPGSSASKIGIIAGLCEGINGGTVTLKNCYYDSDIITGFSVIGAKNGEVETSITGLTTAQMTGTDALSNMTGFAGTDWLTKADGADEDSGKYYWFYPHLKGFAYDSDPTVENWPAKAEVTVKLSEYSFGYDGESHMPTVTSVTIGDTSIPEGTIVTYSKYGSTWGTESELAPTDPGKYRMTISSGDEVVETKYFTILSPDSDYTVNYYKLNGESWSSDSVNPVDAGNYKAVLTFLKEKVTGEGVTYNPDESHTPIEKEFKITPKDITVTAASEEFTYDGTAHSNNNYEVDGLVGSDAITAVVTGSITYPSESPVPNVLESYEFTSGSPGNYNVTTVNGKLTMSNASVAITITSASGDWIYDGNAHSDNTVKVTNGELLTGDTLVATATGSVTNVSDTATGNNPIAEGYKIMHGDVDVTANYTITAVNGTLTIKPASATVAITGHNNTTPYDGEEHTVSGYDVKISNPLYTESDFKFSGTAEAKRTDAGTTNMGLAADQFTNTNPNYDVTFNFIDGYLEVTAINVYVSVKGNSATEDYDGSEKSATGYTATASNSLYDVENDIEFSGTAEAKRTEPGNESMGLDASQFSNKNANFNATFTVEEDGKLTVNPVIKFVNEDGSELQSGAVAYGEKPEYKGDTPAKAASDGSTYEFAGWSPEITEATANATYTATYKSTAIGLELGEIENSTGYKEDQTFTVDTSSLPEGAEVHWFVNGEDVSTGDSYTVEEPTDDYTVQAKAVDKDGNVIDETSAEKVKVKNSIFDKIKWFFSNLLKNFLDAIFGDFSKIC